MRPIWGADQTLLTLLTTLIANVNRNPKSRPMSVDQFDPWSRINRLKSKPPEELTSAETFELLKDMMNG